MESEIMYACNWPIKIRFLQVTCQKCIADKIFIFQMTRGYVLYISDHDRLLMIGPAIVDIQIKRGHID